MTGGNAFLVHFDGATWQPVDPGIDGPLNAITGLAQGEMWIGGDSGSLLHGVPPPR